jgi:hypothetical protein
MTGSWKVVAAVALAASLTAPAPAAQEPRLADVLARAEQYVTQYERRFSVLVAEEHYVQEIRRPDTLPVGGGNLTRANPGGGFMPGGGGGVTQRRTLRSDYLLVQLDMGAGWMPFRDVFDVDGKHVRDREDRLVELFVAPHTDAAFDQADRIMADSTRYNIGAVTRTINIPTLALLFLHPDIRPRFQFSHQGVEAVAGRDAWVLDYRETRRPTLIRTTNGRDLALTGRVWIDPATGVVLKTHLTAADPVVRATVTVTFREDADLDLWVPAQMDEHYKAARDMNDIHGLATYTNYRKFQVSTDEAVRKPPGGDAAR